ncbi:hypothetical protein BJX61DRAFT_537328 [Aspergillus egyptiacus]|nr:hypothetical protein BJX61DRAFT_537328 [Aspergillus egyptiacus]
MDYATLQTQLCAAQDLDSVQSVVKHELPAQPTPTRMGVRLALMVALRVAELVCQSIDRLLEQPDSETTGASHDTGMYRPCRRGNGDHHVPVDNEQGLQGLIPMIDVVTDYLEKLGAFDDYASVVTRLVQVSSFHHDNDDLIVHRCLLASHALAAGYIAAKQSELSAADYPHGALPVRYPKDNIITCNSGMCFDAGMRPRLAFISYKENLCWLADWALAHREDGDILPMINSIVGSNSATTPTANSGVRNKVGSQFTRWLAKMDHVVKESTNPSLTHTGVLCTVGGLVRKVLVASVSYGSWQFWPIPRQMTFDDYTKLVCAYIGAMSPQTYFFIGLRHHGFARRVDNPHETKTDSASYHMPVRQITPYCSPIAAGDDIPVFITKLLALCGIQLWGFQPRMCSKCQFDGYRAQLFMLSVGVARLAAMVLDHDQRRPLVRLMDTYGYRLFPALQARLLVLCPCVPRWTSDVMSQAYADAGTSCGQSDCSIPASQCHSSELPVTEEHNLTEALLCQALAEAETYANKTGQKEWFDTVSKPFRI